ncbi:MGMT family protein [Desulfoluna spongiiphila]|uniref:Methylated-DNA-protein-cysteine methyltransferase related protein n=1 Tax=Desulfoluna spongiiphila TaxID=419481 RepID=A0A1G5ABM2_9BACT|nr:MGMT family protein [Desulfoluna spongiiphila]SCX75282.1 methylated-DNA-protein-cysteine methyltransferase related protein [Desulfoluna spongiiphila]
MSQSPFTRRVIALIHSIPSGRVCTYGLLAASAGNPKGARQVSRILHSCSQKEGLPWHRVVNRMGRISLTGSSLDVQKGLLMSEGISFDPDGGLDLDRYLWVPSGLSFS